MLELRPVIVDGEVQLVDGFRDGEWLGSRRTLRLCMHSWNHNPFRGIRLAGPYGWWRADERTLGRADRGPR